MAINLMRQSIELEQLVGESATQMQVKAEALVPGAGREEATVLLEDARVIRGQRGGSNRIGWCWTARSAVRAAYRMGEDSQCNPWAPRPR